MIHWIEEQDIKRKGRPGESSETGGFRQQSQGWKSSGREGTAVGRVSEGKFSLTGSIKDATS